MHVYPGKSYSPLGPETAPASANIRPAISSNSFVVTPGTVAAFIASRISAQMRPIFLNACISSCVVTIMCNFLPLKQCLPLTIAYLKSVVIVQGFKILPVYYYFGTTFYHEKRENLQQE